MKTETYLNACVKLNRKEWTQRSYRQYQAFRARILRMDAEKDAEIESLENELVGWHEHCYGDENED